MSTKASQEILAVSRHPVVVVLGHIDHGKTTLLDHIRKSNVALREAGGITQHLAAYEIVWKEKKITFLDTPGHETFSKMRSRGASVADVAILVVAADDGVKPQTKEAYEAIQKAGIPFVVALNKMDKPTADPDRAKATLAEMGVLVEGWGGTVPVVGVSAKEGTGIDELLDTVLLLAELQELKGTSTEPGQGFVIESHLDARRGPSALLLITSGVVAKGHYIVAEDAMAPVRILEDSIGKPIQEAYLSTPVRVIGFSKVPKVGVAFRVFESKKEAESTLSVSANHRAPDTAKATLAVMVKADVAGSLEALTDEVERVIPPELAVKFFEGGVGDISESDIKAISSAEKAFIIGFHTKCSPNVVELAKRFDITIRLFDVVYEAVDWIKSELVALRPKQYVREDVGKLLVLKMFQSNSGGRVVGGRVREGRVPLDAQFDIIRQGEKVGHGTIKNIERNKAKVEALKESEEGGLLVHSSKAIEERDILSFYYEREA